MKIFFTQIFLATDFFSPLRVLKNYSKLDLEDSRYKNAWGVSCPWTPTWAWRTCSWTNYKKSKLKMKINDKNF